MAGHGWEKVVLDLVVEPAPEPVNECIWLHVSGGVQLEAWVRLHDL